MDHQDQDQNAQPENSSAPVPAAIPTSEGPSPSSAQTPPTSADLGAQLYEWRNRTPVILALIVLVFAAPSARSATIGMLLILWGVVLRLYSAAYLGESTWSRSPTPRLATIERRGPYAFVRHPLYCGNFLILTGFAAYSGALWLTVLTMVAFGFQYYCVAKYEDSVLEDAYGESFTEYQSSVPAWIPARPIRLEEMDWPSSWTLAITTEKKTLVAIVILLTTLLFLG